MPWIGPMRSRSTCRPWPPWPACGRRTGASPRSASTSASAAWGPSAGPSARSSARRPPTTARATTRSRRRTASRWRPPDRGWRPAWAGDRSSRRSRDPAVSEKHSRPPRRNLGPHRPRAYKEPPPMITTLNVASIYVLDKEEALAFYVDKLGLETGNDIRRGDYRWRSEEHTYALQSPKDS